MAPRNGAALSFSGVDGAFDTEELTHNTGCRFRYISIHELLDQASPALPGGNHTTPGRDTWDITDEDLAEIEAAADDLISRAEEVEVDRRYVVNSLKFFKTVRKHMDRLDCCGFTAPCPDSCSTRRLNEEQFTFCLAHSLNMRDGLPSACEYDACSVVTQQALIAVSGQRCFMGNTMPVVKEADGEWATFGLGGIEDEDMPLLDEHEGHLYMMVHSVPNPRMNDPLEDGPYSLRHFAEEQGFGAVYRYDFNRDKGKAITVARFSPNGRKLLVARGTIVCGNGFRQHSCNTAIVFSVADQGDLFEKQMQVGNHLACVYGDYLEEMAALGKSLGIEVITA